MVLLIAKRSTGEIIPGHWRRDSTAATSNDESLHGAVNIGPIKGCRPDDDALLMRNCLTEYINSEFGSLSWQLDYVCGT